MSKKKVLLAVCGSISFYKAFEILSALKKSNFDVYVALSDGTYDKTSSGSSYSSSSSDSAIYFYAKLR